MTKKKNIEAVKRLMFTKDINVKRHSVENVKRKLQSYSLKIQSTVPLWKVAVTFFLRVKKDKKIAISNILIVINYYLKLFTKKYLISTPQYCEDTWGCLNELWTIMETNIKFTNLMKNNSIAIEQILAHLIDMNILTLEISSQSTCFDVCERLLFLHDQKLDIDLDVLLHCKTLVVPQYRKISHYISVLRIILIKYSKEIYNCNTFLKMCLLARILLIMAKDKTECSDLLFTFCHMIKMPNSCDCEKFGCHDILQSISTSNQAVISFIKNIDVVAVFKALYTPKRFSLMDETYEIAERQESLICEMKDSNTKSEYREGNDKSFKEPRDLFPTESNDSSFSVLEKDLYLDPECKVVVKKNAAICSKRNYPKNENIESFIIEKEPRDLFTKPDSFCKKGRIGNEFAKLKNDSLIIQKEPKDLFIGKTATFDKKCKKIRKLKDSDKSSNKINNKDNDELYDSKLLLPKVNYSKKQFKMARKLENDITHFDELMSFSKKRKVYENNNFSQSSTCLDMTKGKRFLSSPEQNVNEDINISKPNKILNMKKCTSKISSLPGIVFTNGINQIQSKEKLSYTANLKPCVRKRKRKLKENNPSACNDINNSMRNKVYSPSSHTILKKIIVVKDIANTSSTFVNCKKKQDFETLRRKNMNKKQNLLEITALAKNEPKANEIIDNIDLAKGNKLTKSKENTEKNVKVRKPRHNLQNYVANTNRIATCDEIEENLGIDLGNKEKQTICTKGSDFWSILTGIKNDQPIEVKSKIRRKRKSKKACCYQLNPVVTKIVNNSMSSITESSTKKDVDSDLEIIEETHALSSHLMESAIDSEDSEIDEASGSEDEIVPNDDTCSMFSEEESLIFYKNFRDERRKSRELDLENKIIEILENRRQNDAKKVHVYKYIESESDKNIIGKFQKSENDNSTENSLKNNNSCSSNSIIENSHGKNKTSLVTVDLTLDNVYSDTDDDLKVIHTKLENTRCSKKELLQQQMANIPMKSKSKPSRLRETQMREDSQVNKLFFTSNPVDLNIADIEIIHESDQLQSQTNLHDKTAIDVSIKTDFLKHTVFSEQDSTLAVHGKTDKSNLSKFNNEVFLQQKQIEFNLPNDHQTKKRGTDEKLVYEDKIQSQTDFVEFKSSEGVEITDVNNFYVQNNTDTKLKATLVNICNSEIPTSLAKVTSPLMESSFHLELENVSDLTVKDVDHEPVNDFSESKLLRNNNCQHGTNIENVQTISENLQMRATIHHLNTQKVAASILPPLDTSIIENVTVNILNDDNNHNKKVVSNSSKNIINPVKITDYEHNLCNIEKSVLSATSLRDINTEDSVSSTSDVGDEAYEAGCSDTSDEYKHKNFEKLKSKQKKLLSDESSITLQRRRRRSSPMNSLKELTNFPKFTSDSTIDFISSESYACMSPKLANNASPMTEPSPLYLVIEDSSDGTTKDNDTKQVDNNAKSTSPIAYSKYQLETNSENVKCILPQNLSDEAADVPVAIQTCLNTADIANLTVDKLNEENNCNKKLKLPIASEICFTDGSLTPSCLNDFISSKKIDLVSINANETSNNVIVVKDNDFVSDSQVSSKNISPVKTVNSEHDHCDNKTSPMSATVLGNTIENIMASTNYDTAEGPLVDNVMVKIEDNKENNVQEGEELEVLSTSSLETEENGPLCDLATLTLKEQTNSKSPPINTRSGNASNPTYKSFLTLRKRLKSVQQIKSPGKRNLLNVNSPHFPTPQKVPTAALMGSELIISPGVSDEENEMGKEINSHAKIIESLPSVDQPDPWIRSKSPQKITQEEQTDIIDKSSISEILIKKSPAKLLYKDSNVYPLLSEVTATKSIKNLSKSPLKSVACSPVHSGNKTLSTPTVASPVTKSQLITSPLKKLRSSSVDNIAKNSPSRATKSPAKLNQFSQDDETYSHTQATKSSKLSLNRIRKSSRLSNNNIIDFSSPLKNECGSDFDSEFNPNLVMSKKILQNESTLQGTLECIPENITNLKDTDKDCPMVSDSLQIDSDLSSICKSESSSIPSLKLSMSSKNFQKAIVNKQAEGNIGSDSEDRDKVISPIKRTTRSSINAARKLITSSTSTNEFDLNSPRRSRRSSISSLVTQDELFSTKKLHDSPVGARTRRNSSSNTLTPIRRSRRISGIIDEFYEKK